MKNKKQRFFKKHEVKIKILAFFVVCQLVFVPFFSFILVYYGPFSSMRDILVSTAMKTMNHKYIATWFLSDKKINEILERTKISEQIEDTNLEDIIISKDNLSGLDIIDIKKKSFSGKLMTINDPSRVKLGVALKLGQEGSTLSQIVKNENAVAGVNAGGFDDTGTGTGGGLFGLIIKDGEILCAKTDGNSGMLKSVIGLNYENKLVIKSNVSISQIGTLNLRDAISFGPALVINGQRCIESTRVGDGYHPRTAIAQRKDGTVLLLVIDGRGAGGSFGCTYYDIQEIFMEHGAYNAANLDGGSSATMYFNGKVANTPSDIMGERSIPNAFIVS